MTAWYFFLILNHKFQHSKFRLYRWHLFPSPYMFLRHWWELFFSFFQASLKVLRSSKDSFFVMMRHLMTPAVFLPVRNKINDFKLKDFLKKKFTLSISWLSVESSSLLISVICAGEFELSDSVLLLPLGDERSEPEKAPLLFEYSKWLLLLKCG